MLLLRNGATYQVSYYRDGFTDQVATAQKALPTYGRHIIARGLSEAGYKAFIGIDNSALVTGFHAGETEGKGGIPDMNVRAYDSPSVESMVNTIVLPGPPSPDVVRWLATKHGVVLPA